MTPDATTPDSSATPAPKRHTRRAILAAGSLGVLTAGGLATWAYMPGGYMTYDARLYRALKADSMAEIPLLGRQPVFVSDQEPCGLICIERTSPYLKRFFRDDSVGPKALAEEFITHAQQVGWKPDMGNSSEDRWIGRRQHKDFPYSFSISVYTLARQKPEDVIDNSVAIKIGS